LSGLFASKSVSGSPGGAVRTAQTGRASVQNEPVGRRRINTRRMSVAAVTAAGLGIVAAPAAATSGTGTFYSGPDGPAGWINNPTYHHLDWVHTRGSVSICAKAYLLSQGEYPYWIGPNCVSSSNTAAVTAASVWGDAYAATRYTSGYIQGKNHWGING